MFKPKVTCNVCRVYLLKGVTKATNRHEKYVVKCFTWNQHITMRKEHTKQTNDKKKAGNNYNNNTDNYRDNSDKK